MAARCARSNLNEAKQRALELLERLQLADRLQQDVRQLSGGERQRVAIARAFLNRPALVLADEPTGNLDPETAQQVMELLRDAAHQDQAGVVLVTHDATIAAMADRQLQLRDHQLHETGPAQTPG